MTPILTTSQSRWLLSLLVVLLSAVAVGSSASQWGGGVEMYSGRAGDIRGMSVLLGVAGLGIVGLCRLTQLILPRPWRLYSDRMEFTLVAMLWICWTSATMSFSIFTLGEGVCSKTSSNQSIELPTCPLLTFDLALLHLLSTATLALLLVTTSTIISPSYASSLSNMDGKQDQGEEGGLIMWELAVNSPPSSPTLRPSNMGSSSYGATDTIPSRTIDPPIGKRDKFAEGRVIIYGFLLLVSISVVISAVILMALGEFVTSSIFLITIGSLSTAFAATFLYIHRTTSKLDSERRTFLRALEVGSAVSLFLLWPLAAISFTLFPSIPNRACDNPASSVIGDKPPEAFTEEGSTCILSFAIITLAWMGAWTVFTRLLGIVFPLPNMSKTGAVIDSIEVEDRNRGEGSRLLPPRVVRPQVGYGRIVAGEAFELGDEDD